MVRSTQYVFRRRGVKLSKTEPSRVIKGMPDLGDMSGGGEGGGGHCLFEGGYPLPNYLPCFAGMPADHLYLMVIKKSRFLNTK